MWACEATVVPKIHEFLLRVLPWPGDDLPGYCNTHVMGTGSDGKKFWSGTPCRDVDQFLQAVHSVLAWRTPPDVYMCMSRQAHTKPANKDGKLRAAKSKENALAFKGIYMDVDLGKPPKPDGSPSSYKSVQDAVVAVREFCKAIKIPIPTAIVGSGGGIHVHWISDRQLTPQEWQPYADGLKQRRSNTGCCSMPA